MHRAGWGRFRTGVGIFGSARHPESPTGRLHRPCISCMPRCSGFPGRGGEAGRRQGIGRSAWIAGAILMAAGVDPEVAVATIQRARGVDVSETDEQKRWITDFASWLGSARAGQRVAGSLRRRPRG